MLDATLAPVPGASILVANQTVTTAADGSYRMQVEPGEQTVSASASGFRGDSQTIVVLGGGSSQVDFRLARITESRPHETTSFEGFLECFVVVAAGHSHGPNGEEGNELDCGAPETDNVWALDVEGGVQGILFEVTWVPETELGNTMRAILEVPDSDVPEPLVVAEGGPGLSLQLSRLQAWTYYEQNGPLRLSVWTGSGIADASSDVVVGAHIDQEFTVYATAFYDEGVPRDFSFVNP